MFQSKQLMAFCALVLMSLAVSANSTDPNSASNASTYKPAPVATTKAEPVASPSAKPATTAAPSAASSKSTGTEPNKTEPNFFKLDPVAAPQPKPEPIRKHRLEPNTSVEEKQLDSILEARRTNRFPERLSVYVEPQPFNLDRFEYDPDAYMSVAEPGRVYQTAAPNSGAPVMRIVGQPAFALNSGERVSLQVQSAPGFPVTFHAPRGGGFEGSGLCTVTVLADSQGYAEATYFIKDNSPGDTAVIVGSPMAIGNVSFPIHVRAGGL